MRLIPLLFGAYISPGVKMLINCRTPIASLTGDFIGRTYGDTAWSSVLHKLGLAHHWSEAWLPTCPNPDRLMTEYVLLGRGGGARLGEG